MKKLDIVSALVMLGLAAIVVVETWDLPYWDRFAPGSSFAPFWVAGAGALAACVLLVQALHRSVDEPAEWPDGTGLRRVVFSFATLCLVLAALPWLGTVVSGLLVHAALPDRRGPPPRRSLGGDRRPDRGARRIRLRALA